MPKKRKKLTIKHRKAISKGLFRYYNRKKKTALKKKAIKRKELLKKLKTPSKFTRNYYLKQGLKKAKKDSPLKKLTGKNVAGRVELTKAIEYTLRKPLASKLIQLEVMFKFSNSETKEHKIILGRSRKRYLPKGFKSAFDEAYKMALTQVTFYPDTVRVLQTRYIYYEKIPKKYLNRKYL